MKRMWSVFIIGLLLAASIASAQTGIPTVGGRLQNAAVATGNGNTLDVSGMSVVAFQTSGTFVGTVVFEGTSDGTNWVSLTCYTLNGVTQTSSSTTARMLRCSVAGIPSVRARISAYTSGSITAFGFAGPHGTVLDNRQTVTVTRGEAPTADNAPWTFATGSTDAFGTVTATTTANGTVQFTTAYTSAPVCVMTNQTAARGRVATTATTGFGLRDLTAGDVVYYACFGGN